MILMKPKKYADKIDLSSVKFEDALKALVQIKPPIADKEKTEKPNDSKAS